MRTLSFQWVGLGLVCLTLLQGCLGYKSEFSCVGDPDGGVCDSVPDVYRLGSQPNVESHSGRSGMDGEEWARVNGTHETVLGKPIVNGPVVYTGWVAPWKDDGGKRVFEGAIVYLLLEGPSFDYGQPGPLTRQGGLSRRIVPTAYPDTGKKPFGGIADVKPKNQGNSQEYVNRAMENIRQYTPPKTQAPVYRPVHAQPVGGQ